MGETLKKAGLSLLAGAILVLAGVLLIDIDSWWGSTPAVAIQLDEGTARVNNRAVALTDGALHLTFPEDGILSIGLTVDVPVQAAHYRYLHLSLHRDGMQGYLALAPLQAHRDLPPWPPHTLENRHRDSLWINTAELPGWEGFLKPPFLNLVGEPGTAIEVRDISLHGPSLGRRLAAIYDDWTVYEPWDRAAMNTHTGVTQLSSFYPVILAASWLVLSLGCYSLYILVGRGARPFDWQVVGLTLLACWLPLDAAWQQRLLYQVVDTRAQFAGLTTDEKRRVGPDAEIVAFVEQMLQHIPSDARVFVVSDDDYHAMRTAYYLYPRNVYWRMQLGPPLQKLLLSGDFFVIMSAPRVRYHKNQDLLYIPDTGLMDVDQLVDERFGALYRLR